MNSYKQIQKIRLDYIVCPPAAIRRQIQKAEKFRHLFLGNAAFEKTVVCKEMPQMETI